MFLLVLVIAIALIVLCVLRFVLLRALAHVRLFVFMNVLMLTLVVSSHL